MKFIKYIAVCLLSLIFLNLTALENSITTAEEQQLIASFNEIDRKLQELDISSVQDFERACLDPNFNITSEKSLKLLREKELVAENAHRPSAHFIKAYNFMKTKLEHINILVAKLYQISQKMELIRAQKGELSEEFAQEYSKYTALVQELNLELKSISIIP